MERVLDYIPRLIAANKDHRIELSPAETSIFWNPGKVLDQGREGACVGFGTTGEYGASPVRGTISDYLALQVYRRAKEIDEFEGVDYEGTSVRAGMLVGREKGWWDGFKWAFSIDELKAALRLGPVVLGVDWYESMYDAPKGIVTISGEKVGGHCILLTGYSPNYNRRGPAFRLRNSWGASWGTNGNAYISQKDLSMILFEAGGEAAVPIGRKLA